MCTFSDSNGKGIFAVDAVDVQHDTARPGDTALLLSPTVNTAAGSCLHFNYALRGPATLQVIARHATSLCTPDTVICTLRPTPGGALTTSAVDITLPSGNYSLGFLFKILEASAEDSYQPLVWIHSVITLKSNCTLETSMFARAEGKLVTLAMTLTLMIDILQLTIFSITSKRMRFYKAIIAVSSFVWHHVKQLEVKPVLKCFHWLIDS